MKLVDYQGNSFQLAPQPLSAGNEGAVHDVTGHPDIVAKIYNPTKLAGSPTLEDKIRAMIRDPVRQPSSSHVSIAWPETALYDKGSFVGFTMSKISGKVCTLDQFIIPAERLKLGVGYTKKYLYRIAYNLAVCVDAVHRTPHVIGDMNERNIMVDQGGLVTIIDTDSFQILSGTDTYRNEVGRPEFSPPELLEELARINGGYSDVARTHEHDRFALGVMIFMLLCQGEHPFNGRLLDPSISVGKPMEEWLIEQRCYPYTGNQLVKPNPGKGYGNLPRDMRDAFTLTFADGSHDPSKRLSGGEWKKILEKAETNLLTCSNDVNHVYEGHLPGCPFCLASTQQKPVSPPPRPSTPFSSGGSASSPFPSYTSHSAGSGSGSTTTGGTTHAGYSGGSGSYNSGSVIGTLFRWLASLAFLLVTGIFVLKMAKGFLRFIFTGWNRPILILAKVSVIMFFLVFFAGMFSGGNARSPRSGSEPLSASYSNDPTGTTNQRNMPHDKPVPDFDNDPIVKKNREEDESFQETKERLGDLLKDIKEGDEAARKAIADADEFLAEKAVWDRIERSVLEGNGVPQDAEAQRVLAKYAPTPPEDLPKETITLEELFRLADSKLGEFYNPKTRKESKDVSVMGGYPASVYEEGDRRIFSCQLSRKVSLADATKIYDRALKKVRQSAQKAGGWQDRGDKTMSLGGVTGRMFAKGGDKLVTLEMIRENEDEYDIWLEVHAKK